MKSLLILIVNSSTVCVIFKISSVINFTIKTPFSYNPIKVLGQYFRKTCGVFNTTRRKIFRLENMSAALK
jgi:hypothetical protein